MNNQYIGKIVDDHFDFIPDPDMYDWDQGGDFIEVVDGKKNIIFEMKYVPPKTYKVHGYFMHKNSIVVAGNGLRRVRFDTPGWKDSIISVLKITPNFSPRWKNGYKPY